MCVGGPASADPAAGAPESADAPAANAPNAARDAELPALAAYLAHVARASKGLSAFDHGKWRDVWKKIREGG